MPDLAPESIVLSSLEERVRKAFDVRGAFPVSMGGGALPVITLFNADAPGFHAFSGRVFAGQDQSPAAVGGASKVILLAGFECVVERHSLNNQGAAAELVNLRVVDPLTVDAFVYNPNRVFWCEGVATAAELESGLRVANPNDALTPGSIIWRGNIPPLSTLTFELPVHLLPGARLLALSETLNSALAYSFSGHAV